MAAIFVALNQSSMSTPHFLFPSTLFAARKPSLVRTILGSCVSVCLYDATLKQGGMNHYLLPKCMNSDAPSPKYGNVAIKSLIERMMEMGSKPQNLVAKIFGGSDNFEFTKVGLGAGKSNIEEAEIILSQYGIQVIEKSTGGCCGRKILFDTNTGETSVIEIP